MVHHYRLDLEYDGGEFHGWQRQRRGVLTVQAVVERALGAMLQEPITLRAASRTDTGVHALAQVAAFSSSRSLPPAGLRRGLNSFLPATVAVTRALELEAGFNPRRQVRWKRYRYLVRQGAERRVFCDRHAWRVGSPLNLEAMSQAAAALAGRHDFSAFADADGDHYHACRRVLSALWRPLPGDLLAFDITATAFLKHMVRSLVGTLVEVGRGRFPREHLAALLASGQRSLAGPTAPPQGLWLAEMDYPPEQGGKAPAVEVVSALPGPAAAGLEG